jgi:hypothetical protein
VAEFEFGLEEVGLQPVHGVVGQDAGLQVERGGAGDDRAGGQDGLVVAQDLLVADLGVDEGHGDRGVFYMRVIQRQ